MYVMNGNDSQPNNQPYKWRVFFFLGGGGFGGEGAYANINMDF